MAGKGDTPRPVSVDRGTYDANWERTFGGSEEPTCPDCGRPLIRLIGEYDREWYLCNYKFCPPDPNA